MTNISARYGFLHNEIFLKALTFSFQTHWYLIVMSSGTKPPSAQPNSDMSFKSGAGIGFELGMHPLLEMSSFCSGEMSNG